MIDRNTTSPFGSKIGASSLILLTALNRDLLELRYSPFPVHQSKFLGHNRALTWSWGLHTLRKIKKTKRTPRPTHIHDSLSPVREETHINHSS